MATRWSALLGAPVAPVIRSATAVAAATCSCMVLLFGSSCVLNGGGGVGVRVAVGSFFAVVLADFAFLVMEWAALSRPRRGGGFSLLSLVSLGGRVFSDAGSIG